MRPTQIYKQAFEAARNELVELLNLQEKTERRIVEIKQTLVALKKLVAKEDAATLDELFEMQGLTEGIRVALRTSRKPLTPADVEEHLVAVGYPLSTYTNPRSAIYTILSRLVQSGEAKAKSLADGKAGYEWIHRFPRLAKSDRDK